MSAEHQKYVGEAFQGIDSFDRLLAVYTGAASTLLMNKEKVFDDKRALELMTAFKVRLPEIMNSEAKRVLTEAYKGEDPVVRDQLIGLFADIVEEIFKV